MNISSPALLGAIRGLGFVLLVAVLGWLGDATNLQGIFSPAVDSLIAIIALAIEHSIEAKTGSAMFGAIKIQK